MVGLPCLKEAIIPNALIGLQPEKVSADKRNERVCNLDNHGIQKQVRLRPRREGNNATPRNGKSESE